MGVCPICFEGLKSPACCVPCGHVFCKVCISRWSAYNNRSLEEVLYHYSPQRSRSCPQCRTDIHSIQRIRFDVDEIPGSDEPEIDPWETNDYSTILKSVYNIWFRSELRKACISAQSRILSVPIVQKSWDAGKLCVNKMVDFVSDFRNVEGGQEMKIEWLKNQAKETFVALKNRIATHPRVESLSTQWSNYNVDTKKTIMFRLFVVCVVILGDAQNQQGFLQSVVLPVFQAVLSIMWEIFFMLLYCLTRPITCLLQIFLSVVLMILDILGAILHIPFAILNILLWLPYTMVLGLAVVLSSIVSTVLKSGLPFILVCYALFPGIFHEIQRKLGEIHAGLQQRPDSPQGETEIN
uniref:Uncharacterized protein LOC111135712 isoform X2 n=1 Tax=Crassostrea virginica TaxID=6565 RepID=A0A8B8EP64_CRAVI|nr:uncharacterized protein LOC111135712 isoform X2 [Crassostrea virginica]